MSQSVSDNRPHRFADFFEYETVEQTKTHQNFMNCRLLKRLVDNETKYEVGTVIYCIVMAINFYFWDENDDLTEDMTVYV